ncbi:ead/Ea22-like family protein [Enterobacter ludwigii]
MSNIDKLKSAAAKAADNFDPNMFAETRDVLALLDELEAAEQERKNWRTSFDNERFRADKLAAEMEARGKQIADDLQIKARLCRESNSLHDRLREAEKRIAELEARDKPKFVQCWSCKHDIEVLAIADCDGYCPRCAAPIDLDDEPYAAADKGEAS